MQKKKIIIIGAGISGLSSGIYALDNGFDVEIYEKHYMSGGECTGWYRDGLFIDGCAHWLIGTSPKSYFYSMWRHVGAITDSTIIHPNEYFLRYHFGNETLTIYSHLDELEKELLRIAPDDKGIIKHIIKRIKAYSKIVVPTSKPIDMMNIFELMRLGIRMLPIVKPYFKSKKESLEELSNKIKSPFLKTAIYHILANKKYNTHSFYYTMGCLAKDDGGTLEGGSLKMAKRIEEKYKSLGGKLFLNSPVKRIVVENNVAKGIELDDGRIIYGDYIISSVDLHYTFSHLLDEKYMLKSYKNMFKNKEEYLLNSSLFLAFKLNKIEPMLYKTECFNISPIDVGGKIYESMRIRGHSYDKTIDSNVITVLFHSSYGVYKYLKGLSKEDYLAFKKDFGERIRKEIINQTSLGDEDIKLIDVATPLTYERYTNAYKGSYMSFLTTKWSRGLIEPNYSRKLKHFVLAGQWIMPPGGLPIALMSGKYAIVRIAKLNKQKFINKE